MKTHRAQEVVPAGGGSGAHVHANVARMEVWGWSLTLDLGFDKSPLSMGFVGFVMGLSWGLWGLSWKCGDIQCGMDQSSPILVSKHILHNNTYTFSDQTSECGHKREWCTKAPRVKDGCDIPHDLADLGNSCSSCSRRRPWEPLESCYERGLGV